MGRKEKNRNKDKEKRVKKRKLIVAEAPRDGGMKEGKTEK